MTKATTTLANWRLPPFNRWAFRHVDTLIPVSTIAAGKAAPLAQGTAFDTSNLHVDYEGRRWNSDEVLTEGQTDGLLVLRNGKVVYETYPNSDAATRHLMFSVSKSFTGLLAGILAGEGKLDPDAPVTKYVPEIAPSTYGSAKVQHVLDMTVGVSFVEDYLDTKGPFARYRAATQWNPPNPDFGGEDLHQFLATLPSDGQAHGAAFHYISPNSDLLGWIVERAGGAPFAQLFSEHVWKPMGAERDGYITVDANGGSRTAGGICVTLRDLARLGEMVRNSGAANGKQIVPQNWIADMWANGDPAAWLHGDMTHLFPQGRYRSQWYVADPESSAMCAIGIHGQWIYIDPKAELVIVKQSSQANPVDARIDLLNLALFRAIAAVIE